MRRTYARFFTAWLLQYGQCVRAFGIPHQRACKPRVTKSRALMRSFHGKSASTQTLFSLLWAKSKVACVAGERSATGPPNSAIRPPVSITLVVVATIGGTRHELNGSADTSSVD